MAAHRALLWCLVVDDLLHDVGAPGFHAQGYADDITITIYSKSEGVVSERMQVVLKLVER